MAKLYHFIIDAYSRWTPDIGVAQWDVPKLKSRLNESPDVSVEEVILTDPPVTFFGTKQKCARVWADIEEGLYNQGKFAMKSKLEGLADHAPIYGVNAYNLCEADGIGEKCGGSVGIPIWIKATGAVTLGAAVVVSAGILTDNLTSE